MLYGRQSEMHGLDQLLEGAQVGQAGAICLFGDAGMGKSALLSYARERADGAMLVAQTTGVESEAELPFAGLAQLISPFTRLLDVIPAPQAAALRSALTLGPPSPGDRFAAYAATLSLLVAAAAEQPLLVAVDDAHWLDESSREALLFAVRRLSADAIAVVVAIRSGEPHTAEIRSTIQDLPVAALDPDSARALLARDGAPALNDGVTDLIVTGAGGNPLALMEVPQLLSAAQRAGVEPLDQPMPVGTSLVRAFSRRVRLLPSRTRRSLIVAASSDDGRLDAIDTALALVGLELSDLAPAEPAGLADVSQGVVRFAHPLARSSLYHEATAQERREAHAALAVALVRDPGRAAQRAWHLARAALGHDEPAANALEVVGQEALARTSYAAAMSAFARAARISVEPAPRLRRTLGAAAAATVSGQPDVAIALLEPVIAETADPSTRVEAVQMLGMALMLQGRLAEAATILETGAEALSELEPERSSAMFVVVGSIRAMRGESEEVLRFGRRSAELAERNGRAAPFSADTLLGYGLCLRGEVAASEPYLARASAVLQRLDTLSPADGASFQLVFPLIVFPIVWRGQYVEAHQTIDGLIHGCRTTGAREGR